MVLRETAGFSQPVGSCFIIPKSKHIINDKFHNQN